MLCEQVMKRDVKSLTENQTAKAAARLMREAGIGFLPICDAAGKVVGTVTDRDIVIRLAADSGSLETTSLDKVMTHDVVACSPKDDLTRAEELMEACRKSRILCVDDLGRPMGVISLSDIARYEDDQRLSKLLRTITSRESR
jgi:CBS domain-containing protein